MLTTILCYGDSNTWGFPPTDGPRFIHDIRWPGVLQNLLGHEFLVIEEGLPGRTTDLDDKGEITRNGLKYLPACVQSHTPLDLIFIMLGTNDLKARFDRTAADIAQAIERLVQTVRQNVGDNEGHELKICVMSPAPIDPTAHNYNKSLPDFEGGYEKSLQLSQKFKEAAERSGCLFLDIAPHAAVGDDGLHITVEAHAAVAQLIAGVVTSNNHV